MFRPIILSIFFILFIPVLFWAFFLDEWWSYATMYAMLLLGMYLDARFSRSGDE